MIATSMVKNCKQTADKNVNNFWAKAILLQYDEVMGHRRKLKKVEVALKR